MGTLTAAVRRRAINSRAYASVPYRAARMLNHPYAAALVL